jgi:hypothetical protein
MSLQKESYARNPPFNQPGIVWSKRSLTMLCANPQCFEELLYLREGRLELLELESHAEEQFRADDGAFAMRSLPSKCFWLCGECAETYIVKRWTTSGLVVVLRDQDLADSHPDLAARPADTGTTRPLAPLLPLPPLLTALPTRANGASAPTALLVLQ